MHELIVRLKLLAKVVGGTLLAIPFAILFFVMFFGGATVVCSEAYSLMRIDGQTPGKLTEVEITHGSKGGRNVNVTYEFQTDGRQFESRRLYPGPLQLGGSGLVDKYAVGQVVPVFYDSSNPARSCLERGLDNFAIGWTAFIWGIVAAVYWTKNSQVGLAGVALVLYGVGMFFLGPSTVRTVELPWHLLAYGSILAALVIHRKITQQPALA